MGEKVFLDIGKPGGRFRDFNEKKMSGEPKLTEADVNQYRGWGGVWGGRGRRRHLAAFVEKKDLGKSPRGKNGSG